MGQLNRARIIGYLPNGCPVREIRGGSGPVFEPPAGGQQQPPVGGQQQPPADPDLLGGDPPQADPPAGGNPPAEGEQPPGWFAAAMQAQQAAFQSEIDRRIGQLTNPGRRNPNPPAGQPDPNAQPSAQQPAGIDPRDLRDARSVFRDELRDVGFALTAGERELVNQVSGGVVQATLARVGDPDQAGAEAARLMASQIRALRTSHQNDLMARLRALGAIDETKLRTGSASQQQTPTSGYRPGGQVPPADQFRGGVSKAQEQAARRGLATPGAQAPGQQQ